jgi:hypothetical protein
MNQRRALALVLGALAATFVLGVIATVKLAEGHTARRLAGRQPITVEIPAGVGEVQAGGTARHRLSATAVLRGFATSYLAYLDGGPGSGLRYASITASSQATAGGRIPPAFRDGPLRITDVSEQGSTGSSAQATVLASNRSESYPFTVQMLYEQDGWQIAQIVPVDLSIDDHTQPPVGVVLPAAASGAARWFAVAYVNYRAGVTRSLPAIAGAARQAIAQGTDSLAQTRIPRERAVLESISYGPPTGGEFAATATVTVPGQRETFSFLMVRSAAGWVCGAFL